MTDLKQAAQAYLDKCEEVEMLRKALERLLHFARTKAHDDYLNADLKAAKKAARQALGENNDQTG